MSLNNVRHMTWICHLPTLHHTSTHMLGTHASFRVIPTLRRSFTSKTVDRGTRRCTPIALSVRGLTNELFVSICACLAHMYMENQCWTHFTTLFTPVDPYREFQHTDPGF